MTTARRDELGYLFVVTYGRSGSTLLMGLLNSIPGYLHPRRELGRPAPPVPVPPDPGGGQPAVGAGPAASAHAPVLRRRRLPGPQVARGHPAAGARHRAPAQGRHPRHRVQGDPLVRRRRRGVRRVAARGVPGRPLRREHPRPRGGPAAAGGGPSSPENAEQLPAIEERILALAEGLGDAAYRVHYNDYVADPTVLRGLFDWLGEPFDEAAVRSVLETPPLGPRRGPRRTVDSHGDRRPPGHPLLRRGHDARAEEEPRRATSAGA